MKRSLLVAVFLGLAVMAFSSPAAAQCGCYCGANTGYPCSDQKCKQACGWKKPSSGSSSAQPSYDYEAERQRQAEIERQRQEADRQRRQQEADEQRRRDEEKARRDKEKFDIDKQTALDSMKDLDGGSLGLKRDTDSLGLKPLDDSNSGGLGLKDAPNSPSLQKALDDANSNQFSTRQGLQSTTPESKTRGHRSVPTGTGEDASGQARNVFDSAGDRHAASINTGAALRNVGTPPSLKALMNHIPKKALELHNNDIDKSIQWYQGLESTKAETKAKIADAQQKIQSHDGDTAQLGLQKAQWEAEVKTLNSQELMAEKSIKKELLNLNMPWIEAPPADASAGKGKTQ